MLAPSLFAFLAAGASTGAASAGGGFAQDDPAAAAVSLRRIDDPIALERRLRGLNPSSAAPISVTVPDGRAHRGDFRLDAGDGLEGDLLVLEGQADVYGRVGGNLVALDGDVVVHPGGLIEGDALSLGGRVRNLGGTVLGAVREVGRAAGPGEGRRSGLATAGVRLAGLAGVFLTLALIGFGVALFAQPNLETISDTASHSFLRSFLVGLLGQVLVLPTLGLLVAGLVLSVVGVLLVPFVAIAYGLVAVVGVVGGFLGVTHALGATHTRRRMARGVALAPSGPRYLLVGLGAVASVWLGWALFGWVPVAGTLMLVAAGLATWLLATIGFGACVLSRAGVRPAFAGRYLPGDMLTDEYLWATPQRGVQAVKRPPP